MTGFKIWDGTSWSTYTPNKYTRSTNLFPADATFEQGSFEENSSNHRQYEQMKISSGTRIRTARLIEIPGECVLSVASGYKMFICMFDDQGYRTGGEYYPGYVGWTASPILFPYNGRTGVPKYIALAIAKNNNDNIYPSEISNVQVRINAGTTPLPYTPPGANGWIQNSTAYQYTATGWVKQN